MANLSSREWRECKLGDIADLINGYAFKSSDFSDQGTPVIKIKNIASGTLDLKDVQYYPHEVSNKLKQFILKKDDILIAMTGSHVHQPSSMVGKVARYDKTFDALLNQRVGKVVSKNLKILDEDFIYYFLTQKDIAVDLATNAGGSANQANISATQVRNLEIYLPSISEQRAIAAVLSSLDDKIDLLHRQNKTLESFIETLWRKMFVEDADPAWKQGKLGDLIELCYGKGLKEEKRIVGKYPVIGSSGVVGYHNEFLIKGPGIVIGRKGTLGEVHYIEEDFSPIDTTFFIKSRTNQGKLFFEYFLLKEFAFKEMNSDSAVPGLNREIAESMEVVIPKTENILRFNDFCEPTFYKKLKNDNQISTLSRSRDTLLPKLMSGEVLCA